MTVLPWFPYDCDAWEQRVREERLSLEQEGALHRLCRRAWQEQEPCTIHDSEDDFARILGASWRKALPLLRRHFLPDPETPGRLRCTWLRELYDRQLAKHESYQSRGKQGGRPRKAESSASIDESSGNSSGTSSARSRASRKGENGKAEVPNKKAQLTQSSTEGKSSAPAEHRAFSPAPEAARAPVEAPPPGATNGKTPHTAAAAAADLEWQARYGAAMGAKADEWLAAHPDEALDITKHCRKSIGMPNGALGPFSARALRGAIVEAVRERNHWPTAEVWIERKQRDESRISA